MGPCMSSPKGEPLLLPQNASVDAQRERAKHLDEVRNTYAYAYEPFPAHVAKVPVIECPVGGIATLTKVGIHLESTSVADWVNYVAKYHKIYDEQKKAAEGNLSADAFAMYNAIFSKDRLPEIAKNGVWKTDKAFGTVHTDGLFPWYIERAKLDKLREKMNITDDRVDKTTGGKKLADLEKEGRLYVSDHEVLKDIPKKAGAEDVVLIPTITLFWVDDNKAFMPLAIQLGQTTSSPILTPQDGKPNAWLAAKVHVGQSNIMVHSGYYHAFEMHFFMETFWTSCCRNLADVHPLKQLLKPHAYNTLFANFGVRGTLKPDGGLDKLFGVGASGAVVIAENCWKKFGYVHNLDIPANLKRRGLMDIPEFKYRDDAIKYWAVHHTYISGMVNTFYKGDEDVVADYELQNWVKDMADPKTCATPGLPVDPATGTLKTREQLVSFLLCSFFNAVFQHTYVENIGLLYWGYAPMNPCAFRMPIEMLTQEKDITETDIASKLPDIEMAISQNAMSWSVNEVDPNEKLLLGWFPDDFLSGAPPATQDVIKKWREELKTLSDMVQKRDNMSTKPIVWISIIH